MSSTFRVFCRSLEGHLLQVGAGYMLDPSFIATCKDFRSDCFRADEFWNQFKLSELQAIIVTQYLYAILVTATKQ